MAFTIPNYDDAGDPNQAEVDKVDIDILLEGYKGNGVISGCAVTAQGTPDDTVAVASGVIQNMYAGDGSQRVTVSGGNVTCTAHSTANSFFLITANTSGAVSSTQGATDGSEDFPAIPANSIVLAAVYVRASDSTIETADITDKRVSVIPVGVNSSQEIVFNEAMGFRSAPSSASIFEILQSHATATGSNIWRVFRTGNNWDAGAGVSSVKVEQFDSGGGLSLYDGTSGHEIRSGVFEATFNAGTLVSPDTATVAEIENIRVTIAAVNTKSGTTVTVTDWYGMRVRHSQLDIGTIVQTTIKDIELRNPYDATVSNTNYYGIHIFDCSTATNVYLLEIGTLRGTSATATTAADTYFRVVGNFTAAANQTPVYISEGVTPTLRQLLTVTESSLDTTSGTKLICYLS